MPNEDQSVDLLRLAGLPFFHGMPRWALVRIAQSASELSLPAGHVLLSSSVADTTDHQALLKFLNDEMTPQFRTWVQEAVQLAGDEPA